MAFLNKNVLFQMMEFSLGFCHIEYSDVFINRIKHELIIELSAEARGISRDESIKYNEPIISK